jgi:hypothetical protein
VLDLHVTSDIAHFAGHFPGAALLPVLSGRLGGVFCAPTLALTGHFSALENLNFSASSSRTKLHFIDLGCRPPASRVRLRHAAAQVFHGRILFGGAA